MSKFLLTIDVGNTATGFALFTMAPGPRVPRPRFLGTIGTSGMRPASLGLFLRRRLRRLGFQTNQIRAIYISSVVPPADAALRRVLKKIFYVSPVFVTARTPSKVRVRYRVPSEVGADRLVNARAAMALAPRRPAIVVDFGTATTFDCVTARGEYLGGVIAPGPVISAEALYQKTAKLPRVLLERPAAILGRNTMESMQAGLYHGYRGLVQEIVERLKRKLGARSLVFATGGQARWILRGVRGIDRVVPDLTLLGIYHTWRDQTTF